MPIRFASVKMPWSPRGKNVDTERDADAEIARNLWKHYWLLPPTSFGREVWDWTLLVLVVYSSLQIPFVLAFKLPEATTEVLDNFDYVIDAFFYLDMILIFNTSFYIEEELCSSRKVIARRYGFGWFPVDLVATLPWELLSTSLVSMRLLRLLRLSRVIKKVDSLKGGMALRFFYLIFWWLLIAHWTACVWWYIGKTGWEEQRDDFLAGRTPEEKTTSWLVRIPPNGKVEYAFSYTQFVACWTACVESSANTSNPQSPVQCMSSRECDDNNFNPTTTDEVFNHWLSSLYWAFTMLMKTPYVGPDTLSEKVFSCIMVIIGAIIFALLLGQVTTLIVSAGKAGAALRDALVEYRLFAATRLKGPAMYKLYDMMAKQTQAEWQQTKGMETHAVLEPFPLQLRGDVLSAVYQNLTEVNPPFLRCSKQLQRQILGLLRPAVALKKSTVVAARQFTGSMYILLKGTLQVSQAPELPAPGGSTPGGTSERSEASPGKMSKMDRMSGTKGPGSMKRMNTKNFKDKLKVRMLEKPGACVPLENIYDGAKASPFSVFAVTRCQMLSLDSALLRGVLQAFPAADAAVVTDAFSKEFQNLADSLKMTKNADGTLRSSKLDPDGGESSPSKGKRLSVAGRASVAESVDQMERRATELISQVEELAKMTDVLPQVLKVLETRISAAGGKKPDGGSFFNFGGSPKT